MKNLTFTLAMTIMPSASVAEGNLPPVQQSELNAMSPEEAFAFAFEAGDELTEFSFSAARGVGANIGEGRRFTRIPRADLDGVGEWAQHFPKREGGANATSCIACHSAPIANGAGDVAMNVVVDPGHTGDPAKFLERNTLPLFALAVPQRLAEEISTELYRLRDAGEKTACSMGSALVRLNVKGVDYGTLSFTRTAQKPCVLATDSSGLQGIDDDLVIKAFGWKGNHATIRAFTRGAAHNELGLQAVELVGNLDGDYDGVTQELTVGDMTALTIYMAALERPVSTVEMADLGLMEMTPDQRNAIGAGETLFSDIGCASCHVPTMEVEQTVFSEPSQTPGFFDAVFPDGSDPAAHVLSYATAVRFDLKSDQPNNVLELPTGTHHLGALETAPDGTAIARWFTDFKRHDMGSALADPDDPLAIGASVFLTRSLAGVGSTGPWMHDGRATTLSDAILAHGGAASESRNAYLTLAPEDQDRIVAFLESLVIYHEEEDE